jgi:hypothetical protein
VPRVDYGYIHDRHPAHWVCGVIPILFCTTEWPRDASEFVQESANIFVNQFVGLQTICLPNHTQSSWHHNIIVSTSVLVVLKELRGCLLRDMEITPGTIRVLLENMLSGWILVRWSMWSLKSRHHRICGGRSGHAGAER